MPGGHRLPAALAEATMIYTTAGAHADALPLWPETVERMSASTRILGQEAADLAWAAIDLNRRDEAESVIRERTTTPWLRAADALLRLDFPQAAEEFRSIGHLPYAALAGLYAGGELAALGRSFFHTVGATRYLKDLDRS
jgi:hypothetical protein